VFIWNKTRREYDRLEEKWIVIKNPRKDWVVYYDPLLAIVPISTWTAARKKLSAMRRKNPLTGRKMSRNENLGTPAGKSSPHKESPVERSQETDLD
jgi:hypothetical protein